MDNKKKSYRKRHLLDQLLAFEGHLGDIRREVVLTNFTHTEKSIVSDNIQKLAARSLGGTENKDALFSTTLLYHHFLWLKDTQVVSMDKSLYDFFFTVDTFDDVSGKDIYDICKSNLLSDMGVADTEKGLFTSAIFFPNKSKFFDNLLIIVNITKEFVHFNTYCDMDVNDNELTGGFVQCNKADTSNFMQALSTKPFDYKDAETYRKTMVNRFAVVMSTLLITESIELDSIQGYFVKGKGKLTKKEKLLRERYTSFDTHTFSRSFDMVSFRKGHFRNQAHGKGRKLRKLIYIHPQTVKYNKK